MVWRIWRGSVARYFVVSRGRLDSKQGQKKGGACGGGLMGLERAHCLALGMRDEGVDDGIKVAR